MAHSLGDRLYYSFKRLRHCIRSAKQSHDGPKGRLSNSKHQTRGQMHKVMQDLIAAGQAAAQGG